MRSRFACVGFAAWLFASAVCTISWAGEPSLPLKAGIIGFDAHALSWTKIINDPQATGELANMTIVAGYPGGSADIPRSMEVIEERTAQLRELGVETVDSIDDLLKKVDVVLILSIDGRKHLEEAKPVFAAGKRVFIDKPIAGSLADAIEIFRLSKEHNVPCFTSSSLRFAKRTIDIRQDPKLGELIGCEQYSPCSLEPHHPDFFWYGIHGVEPLFTIMGPGCVSVTRVHTEGTDVAIGIWEGGRIGSVRGIRDSRRGYGSTVFGTKGIVPGGGFDGYEPLIVEIVKFLKTGKPPVTAEETLEIFAFMEAADESKRQGGRPVTLESVMPKPKKLVLFDGKTLDGWEKTNFGGEGEVKVEDGTIIMEFGSSLTGITSTRKDLPTVNYELSFEAMRRSGYDFFAAATFPVGKSHVSFLNGGWGGSVTGISSLDGFDASENETGTFFDYKDKQWYKFCIRITDERIQCRVDGKEVVDVNYKGRQVGTRIEADLSKPLGFAAWETSGAVRKIEIRMLSLEEVAAINKAEE